MCRITRILVLLGLLMVALPMQSTVHANAVCPPEGCRVYMPTIQKWDKPLKIGLVTNTGGIDDKSINQAAWQGVLDAQNKLGAKGAYLVSHRSSDYAKNINSFINQGYNVIITVGFDMGDATKTAALAHPTQKFSIVDFTYTPILSNVIGQAYASEQVAFLCGYLAAGMTETGKVATFGGMKIPTVTQFMNGYYQGVMYYNLENATSVQVLGWDPASQTGEFTDDFNNPLAGLAMAQKLLGQGADIIFPVAGPTGLGAAQAVQLQGNAWVIGVDIDWTIWAPQYSDVVLTSAIKNIRTTTYAVIDLAYKNFFIGGNYVGILANDGVSLGKIASAVPDALLTKLEAVKEKIIDGSIIVTP